MRYLLLAAALAACGDNRHPALRGPDGGVDAPIDAPLAPADVQVLVRDGFAPIAGVRVVFEDAAGPRTELATDATGSAIAAMPDGGHVTVIRTYPAASSQAEIYDYLGVKPGEILHVGHEVDDTTTPTMIAVLVPAIAQGTVTVVTPCGTGQGTAPQIDVSVAACPPMVAFYVEDSRHYGFVAKVPYAVSVDLGDLVMAQPLSTTVLTYDVTPDVSSVTAEARAIDGTHALYSTGIKRVDRGSVQLDMPNLAGAIDELVIGTRVATAGGTQTVGTRSVWAPMPVSVDAASSFPYLRQPATFTPSTITWAEDGTASVDAVLATLEVTRGGSSVPPADATYRRTILAPHGGMALAIPQLTGDDAKYNPGASDQLAGALGLVGSSAGYDALLPWAFGVSNLVEATPPGATVTLSYATGSAPTL